MTNEEADKKLGDLKEGIKEISKTLSEQEIKNAELDDAGDKAEARMRSTMDTTEAKDVESGTKFMVGDNPVLQRTAMIMKDANSQLSARVSVLPAL